MGGFILPLKLDWNAIRWLYSYQLIALTRCDSDNLCGPGWVTDMVYGSNISSRPLANVCRFQQNAMFTNLGLAGVSGDCCFKIPWRHQKTSDFHDLNFARSDFAKKHWNMGKTTAFPCKACNQRLSIRTSFKWVISNRCPLFLSVASFVLGLCVFEGLFRRNLRASRPSKDDMPASPRSCHHWSSILGRGYFATCLAEKKENPSAVNRSLFGSHRLFHRFLCYTHLLSSVAMVFWSSGCRKKGWRQNSHPLTFSTRRCSKMALFAQCKKQPREINKNTIETIWCIKML